MDQSVTPPGQLERWLPVADYEGYYEVSDLGRVRSVPRVVKRPGDRGRCARTSGRILKLQDPAESMPYVTVELWRDGRRRKAKVHILVARAFLGPRPEKHDVCHGPRGKLDNGVTNLSYGTRAKNSGPDKRRDGTLPVGSRSHLARLNDEIVGECRARAAAGESANRLAREFGVAAETMRLAVTGATWRHLPAPVALPRGRRKNAPIAALPLSDTWYGVRLSVPIHPERRHMAA